MDEVVPLPRSKKRFIGAGVAVGAVLFAIFIWQQIPRGLQIPAVDTRSAVVESGTFFDDVVVRAKAEALHSVILDSVESGRVEEVVARDGGLVKQGDVLFRISNAQRNLELLQRQAEHAQQISNLANLRVGFEASNTEHLRRATDLDFNLKQAIKKHARNVQLAAKGFLSGAAIEESADAVAQQQRAVDDEILRSAAEQQVKRSALAQVEQATRSIEQGLALVHGTVDALVVRAPVSGRLTDFSLQVGETVKKDQHIGRIDDPEHFKLTAGVDEYYLNRIAVGRTGSFQKDGQSYRVDVSRVYPQIKDGRFSIELTFHDAQPAALNPGQSLDTLLALGQPKQALLLPNAPFLSDSGGAWVFVLASNGIDAEKRAITVGRRNNRQVEILSGLHSGEKVIISSYAAFGDAARVQLKK